jgi:hypothetical protein
MVGAAGAISRPLGTSPWPYLQDGVPNGNSKLRWQGQIHPRVQVLLHDITSHVVVRKAPAVATGASEDEKQLAIALGQVGALPQTPSVFQGWTIDNKSMAAIAELAARSKQDWTSIHSELDKVQAKVNDEVISKELDVLEDLMPYRAGVFAEAMLQAGAILPYFQGLAGFTAASHPQTTELCLIAHMVAKFMAMHFKKIYDRPRPSELRPALLPPIEVPGHAAFPSGHATEAHLLAHILTAALPDMHPSVPLLVPMAHRIAINREVMGVHYRSDSEAGEVLADATFQLVMTIAGWTSKKDKGEVGKRWRVARAEPDSGNVTTILGRTLRAARNEWSPAPDGAGLAAKAGNQGKQGRRGWAYEAPAQTNTGSEATTDKKQHKGRRTIRRTRP